MVARAVAAAARTVENAGMVPNWLRVRSRAARVALGVAGFAVLALVLLWLSLPDVRPLAAANPPTTAMIELRKRQAAETGKPYKLRWDWRPLSKISPFLQRAVVFAEDAQFWKHEGVDWEAMEEAARHDVVLPRCVVNRAPSAHDPDTRPMRDGPSFNRTMVSSGTVVPAAPMC